MIYFDDLNFINYGYAEKVSNAAKHRLFEGYYGIQFLHKGKMYARTGDHSLEYADAPCVFITWPGIPFDYGSQQDTLRSQAHLCFAGPRVERYVAEGLLPIRETGLFQWLRNPEQFLWTMQEIFRLLRVPGTHQHARAVLHLEELLLQIQEQPAIPDKLYNHYVNDLLNLRDRIALEPLRDWDFQTEARKMGLSYVHFRRIFKQASAWPPGAFLLECRLRYAEKKLINSHDRIFEIAQECGFRDVYHFSRIFRKHCNYSPTQFRALYSNQ